MKVILDGTLLCLVSVLIPIKEAGREFHFWGCPTPYLHQLAYKFWAILPSKLCV
jgi:hypothetical protein